MKDQEESLTKAILFGIFGASETDKRSLESGSLSSVKDPGSALGPANFVICRDRMIESLVRTVKSEGQQALNPLCRGASPEEGKVVSM